MFGLSPVEMIIVGVVAVLLFGSRLPEVGRSLGKSMMEFKKGMRGIEDEINSASSSTSSRRSTHYDDDRDVPTAPKFEPPPAEPKDETVSA